jgi:hypothetical protein
MVAFATSASAVQISVLNNSSFPIANPAAVNINDTFVVQLQIESQSSNLDVVQTSLQWNPAVLSVINIFTFGPCLGTTQRTCTISTGLFTGSGSYRTLGKNFGPGQNPGVLGPGLLRFQTHSNNLGIDYPPYYPSSNWVADLGYANFQAIGSGVSAIDVVIVSGDNISEIIGGIGGQTSTTNFSGLSVTVVPEPATALLMALSLGGLAIAGRKLN